MPLNGLETDVDIDLGLELCARSCAEAVILWYGAVPYQVSPDQNYGQKSCLKGHGREGGNSGNAQKYLNFVSMRMFLVLPKEDGEVKGSQRGGVKKNMAWS